MNEVAVVPYFLGLLPLVGFVGLVLYRKYWR